MAGMIPLPYPFSTLLPEGVAKGEVMLVEADSMSGVEHMIGPLIRSVEKPVFVEIGDRTVIKLSAMQKFGPLPEVMLIRVSNIDVNIEGCTVERIPSGDPTSVLSQFYSIVMERSLQDAVFVVCGIEQALFASRISEALKEFASIKRSLQDATFIGFVDYRAFSVRTLALLESVSTTVVRFESAVEGDSIVRRTYLIKSPHSLFSEVVEYDLKRVIESAKKD
ncbi:hypothetical protein [Archaeoglobus veneficus]|uniref:KaiC-like domain-containing protein n=1 Tax=Archaeoglobus veneficus (strain DSM 11195 / SNP6) TaxID=693661 RepID=F2KSF8_ARCVS|nr:hypothetical protein [Archaeoglobus veneficus]AEA46927.1 hypothetical protein Arcve_0916 [Archaeoglobus veneficus SNP6]